MRRFFIISVVCMLGAAELFSATEASAQRMPERHLVRKGNRQFNRMNYERSAELYMQALAADSTSWEAAYNLGSALFRSERYDSAEQVLARVAADTTRNASERAEAYFNLGDVQLGRQDLQGALESFKNSLRLNPSDMEAKYNYAYTKKLLEQQQDDQQNQDNQDNQDNKDNQNQNNQDNRNNNDDNRDNDSQEPQNDDQNGDGQPQDDNSDNNDRQNEGQQPREGISPEQQAAMLDAIQAQEDKTQEKVKEKQGVIIRGRKNW